MAKKDDKIFQLVTGVGWTILGLLGWSLDRQFSNFQGRVAGIESAIQNLSSTQSNITTSVAELSAHSQERGRILDSLGESQRAYGSQLDKISVIVNELLEIRREERRSNNGKK